ncbi:uncharacterized protein LOC135323723 isoform X1 [Dromaius novaehollandiae]|uniref:uncharacterized protein LOC135323713 isoform X2 n=1 Tax=Dromaius novaehollandiae TaxID=8790 RepID=UPI00311EB7A3
MVRARGASGPGRRLLLLLGLLAALRARDSRAAPRAAPGPGSGLPASQLNLVVEHQGDARDEAVVNGYSGSHLDPVAEARGLPRVVHHASSSGGPRVVEPRRGARGDGYRTFQRYPVLVPREDPRDVAVVDGYAGSRLDPVVQAQVLPRGDGYRTFQRYPVLVPREDPRAVAVGDGDPSSALEPGLETPRHHGGVPIGSGLPASHLDAIVVPQGHARVLPSMSQPGEAPRGRKYAFFPTRQGLAGDKDAEAAAHKGRQKQCLVFTAAVSGSLLFGVLLTCKVISLLRNGKQEAVPANLAAASDRQEPSMEEGRAKPGSKRKKDEFTIENENLNNSSSQLPMPVPNRIIKYVYIFRRE